MARDDRIQLFENKRIRTAWDAEKEEWFFSIVDVVAVLTDQPDQRLLPGVPGAQLCYRRGSKRHL